MLKRLRSGLSYANVMSSIAVFMAMSGVAWAATLPKNSVGSAQLKSNSVTSKKIKNSQVASSDVKNNGLTSEDIRDATLTGGDIADGSIGGGDLAGGVIPSALGGDVSGPLGATTLGANTVNGSKVADGSIGTADLNVTDVTVPVNIGSLAAKQCYAQNVAVPGARPGDVVQYNVPASFLDQVSINAEGVPANDQVTLRFCVSPNATVPTADPPAGNWRFILFH